jgi:hypothetical protein
MNKLEPNETDLLGAWVMKDGKVVGDEICQRIDWLTAYRLTRVGGGGWETLFQDPTDGRYWERTYPHGEMHGGGPPRLTFLPADQAHAKYHF